jgi:hypothetical protein
LIEYGFPEPAVNTPDNIQSFSTRPTIFLPPEASCHTSGRSQVKLLWMM